MLKILVTGGAGYIGSHTCLELLRAGHVVHVVDTLVNGSLEALVRVQRLSSGSLGFSHCDVRDRDSLNRVFSSFKPDAVIHFAGVKAVAESVSSPARYYEINVGGTATLLSEMERAGCNAVVFSSSATVYGKPKYLPCDENHPLDPINPYGRTKLVAERLLQEWSQVQAERRGIALRYFNPIGADASGEIGEDPNETPSNLMPFISQVAIGRKDHLQIFGNDYDTEDGTGVRDYIHVSDLARSHVIAVEKINELGQFEVINIGTGEGLSVLRMVREFEEQSGKKIKFQIAPRRQGDAAAVWADNAKAASMLGFEAQFGVVEMCRDAWHWQNSNPNGYPPK